MEGPHDSQVMSNGTDTYDVAEHDDIFDASGAVDHTHSDDDYEFEHDERMAEEEDHDEEVEDEDGYQGREQVEVEDIFKNDDLATPSDFQPEKSSEVHNDVEDIFQEVGHHADHHEDNHVQDDEEENHDYEPVSFTERVKDEPVIQITFVDAEKSHPAINLGSLEQNGNAELDLSSEELDVPFPDVSNKSDISINWDANEEQEEEGDENSNPAPSSIETMPAASLEDPSWDQGEEEIDEGEVAKFVENILNNSMREVNLASEQEGQSECEEDAADVRESEPAEPCSQERPIETEIVCAQEVKVESSPNVDLFSKLFAKEEEQSVSMETASSEPVDNSAQSIQNGMEEKEDIHHALPVSVGEQTKEDKKEALVAISNEKETIQTPENSIIGEGTASVNGASESSSKEQDFAESRTRKMSVPRPRDVRKDLSETRPSFFGSGSTGSASFLSNTLPRVSVLPRISTAYRKPLTSPVSVDIPSPEKEELPTVEKPDLSKDDTQVISGLTIDLPQVEALSPEPPKSPRKSEDYILPAKESTVCSSPLSPVFASKNASIDAIILDGTSPEELDAIFAKDPEPEPEDPKKSMGKDDVIASTRVRKISRTTWRGQDEYQKSVDKSKVVLDQQQAASLKRYEERKKQRQEAFVGKLRKREDSTSETESEGSTTAPRSSPRMPDVVLALQAKNGKPQSEIVAPKLNLKSVRSLWEQKAAEQEQRRRALQPKRRPMSQGDGSPRPASSKTNYNKPADNIDNSLDDSLDGNTTFSYDGASDDSSSKRESLIERDIRLAKERDLEQMKERERLRSESTSSSRDESQQSETSETQDDQGVDIVRDAELRRDSDDGRSSPSQSSGYTSGRSTPSAPAGEDIHKSKSGKSKMADLKEPLSPTEVEAQHASYKKYQESLKAKDGRFATFPRSKENKGSSSSVSPTNSVGDVPDVIMVDGNSTAAGEKSRKTSLVKQGIMLSQTLEKKKIKTLEKKPRRSLMELEIAAQREKEEAFRREQQTARKISTSSSPSPKISAPSSPLLSPRADHGSNTDISLHISSSSSAASSTATSPSSTPQGSPRKTSTSVSGISAKKVYKDLNLAPQNKKKMALAQHWEHKWHSTDSAK